MERVTGIGGVFFRARDPESLGRWYEQHLGVTRPPDAYGETPWRREEGPTVFAPFPQTTDYFERAEQGWMINFRVRDLDVLVVQLRAAASK
jgi:glyoxylase I family protein